MNEWWASAAEPLVKSTAIGSLALAAGGFSLPFTLRSAAAAVQQAREKSGLGCLFRQLW